jgi:hypothetical protein
MGAIPSVLILLVLLIEHISPSFPQATSEIAHTPCCNPRRGNPLNIRLCDEHDYSQGGDGVDCVECAYVVEHVHLL